MRNKELRKKLQSAETIRKNRYRVKVLLCYMDVGNKELVCQATDLGG